ELAYDHRAPSRLNGINFSGYFKLRGAGRRLLFDSLMDTLDGPRCGEARITLRERPDEQPSELASDRLNVGPLMPVVQALAPLPDEARAWLQGLQPEVQLRNILLSYAPGAVPLERLSYSLNLDQVRFSAHGGVPAAAGVSGSLEGTLQAGVLRLDSHDLSLHLPRLFAEAWHYRRARGRLDWNWNDAGLRLWAPYL